MLCSVVKHAGSGGAQKKCRGKHETQLSVFPHFLSALPLPKCFTTEQSTVKALFVLMTLNKHIYYPTAPRRVQTTPKTSTNITRYLYSRGPVRQVSCL